MARETYVYRDGKLVPKHLAAPLHASEQAAYVIADGMSPTLNPANGQMYDSKSAYQKAVRAAGCEIMGNDTSGMNRRPEQAPAVTGRDIKNAIEQLRSR